MTADISIVLKHSGWCGNYPSTVLCQKIRMWKHSSYTQGAWNSERENNQETHKEPSDNVREGIIWPNKCFYTANVRADSRIIIVTIIKISKNAFQNNEKGALTWTNYNTPGNIAKHLSQHPTEVPTRLCLLPTIHYQKEEDSTEVEKDTKDENEGNTERAHGILVWKHPNNAPALHSESMIIYF